MPYHAAIQFCDERHREGLGGAQRRNDELLLLISRVLNAAAVTSAIAVASASVSLLMTIFGFMRFPLFFLAGQRSAWPAGVDAAVSGS
jgi:hypothetical protein